MPLLVLADPVVNNLITDYCGSTLLGTKSGLFRVGSNNRPEKILEGEIRSSSVTSILVKNKVAWISNSRMIVQLTDCDTTEGDVLEDSYGGGNIGALEWSGDKIVIGAGRSVFFLGSEKPLLKTDARVVRFVTAGGETWVLTEFETGQPGPGYRIKSQEEIFPSSYTMIAVQEIAGVAWFATERAIFRHGSSFPSGFFECVQSPETSQPFNGIAVTSSRVIWVATSGRLYRTISGSRSPYGRQQNHFEVFSRVHYEQADSGITGLLSHGEDVIYWAGDGLFRVSLRDDRNPLLVKRLMKWLLGLLGGIPFIVYMISFVIALMSHRYSWCMGVINDRDLRRVSLGGIPFALIFGRVKRRLLLGYCRKLATELSSAPSGTRALPMLTNINLIGSAGAVKDHLQAFALRLADYDVGSSGSRGVAPVLVDVSGVEVTLDILEAAVHNQLGNHGIEDEEISRKLLVHMKFIFLVFGIADCSNKAREALRSFIAKYKRHRFVLGSEKAQGWLGNGKFVPLYVSVGDEDDNVDDKDDALSPGS